MTIADLLTRADVLRSTAPDKARLLRELAHYAAAQFRLDAGPILHGLTAREAMGSTGVGNGIALPHVRLDDIPCAYGLFAALAKPIEFGAVDDRPVDLVFLLLLPTRAPETQLRSLACVARRLKDTALQASLRRASEPSRLYELLIGKNQ